MHTLLRLPLILLELALRQGAGAIKDILRLVAGGGEDAGPDPVAARREAEVVGAEEARARRPEARPRNAARRRPAPAPAPPARPPGARGGAAGRAACTRLHRRRDRRVVRAGRRSVRDVRRAGAVGRL